MPVPRRRVGAPARGVPGPLILRACVMAAALYCAAATGEEVVEASQAPAAPQAREAAETWAPVGRVTGRLALRQGAVENAAPMATTQAGDSAAGTADTVVSASSRMRLARRVMLPPGWRPVSSRADADTPSSADVLLPEAELKALLAQSFRQAVDRSPKLAQLRATLDAAKRDVEEAEGQRWPQIDVTTQSATLKAGGERSPLAAPNRNSLAVSATTPLYDWGQISKTIESRRKLVEANRFQYEAEAMSLAYDLARNTAEVVKNRLIEQASDQFVERMGSLVKMLQEIVLADRGRMSELTQARARLLQAETSRDAARARGLQFELALKKVLGTAALPAGVDRRWQMSVANLEQLLLGLADHPTIRKADAQVTSAEYQADALHAGALPRLNWVISQSTGVDTLGYRQPLQTGLAINWPLSRGGSQRAAEEAARQRALAGREEMAQVTLDLEFNVRAAERDARTYLERADAYHDLIAETDRVRKDFFVQWHQLGRRSLLDVLTAEGDYYGNVTNEITSRFDGYTSIFREYSEAGALVQWIDPS